MSAEVEALVVGGGVAGAAAAIDLARAGRRVLLMEREAGPHDKVCGEFLSGEGVEALQQLGVDPLALGGRPLTAVRLLAGRTEVETALGFPAVSLSRRRLDEALLARAAALGVELRRGARVTGLQRSGGGWAARTADDAQVEAEAAFLAVGKHDLKGWRRPRGLQNDLVGFKLHWRLAPEAEQALEGRVELFLFPGGYGGLEPVEGGVANLCLLARRSRLAALGGWEPLLAHVRRTCPLLDQRLGGAQPCWPRPLAISGLPYGYRQGRNEDGLWRLGDQAAVIPSFAGEGMSIALLSARLAAEAYLAGKGPEIARRRLSAAVARPLVLASGVSLALTSSLGRTATGRLIGVAPGIMRWLAAATRLERVRPLSRFATAPPQAGEQEA